MCSFCTILGEMLNVKDAYAHPKFFSGIDEMTGFKTRYICIYFCRIHFDIFITNAGMN